MASWSSTARAFSLGAVLASAVLLTACRRDPPLPVYGEVPPFQLIAQTDRPFDSRSLAGKVWVVDFIFTNCPGPCPRMTSQMKQVQRATANSEDVRMVSISIDPKRDTPAVLAAYAGKFRADTSRWVFLTGPHATIQKLSRHVFMLGDVDDSLMHSTRFVLVDRKSRIRGFYDTSDAESIPKLIKDVKSVSAEQS